MNEKNKISFEWNSIVDNCLKKIEIVVCLPDHSKKLLTEKTKNWNLLFSRIDCVDRNDFCNNLFGWPVETFIFQAFAGNALLFIIMIVNDRCILTLDSGCQPIFMVVPEQIQNLQVSYFIWIEINRNHFNVIATTQKGKNDKKKKSKFNANVTN